MLPQLDRTQSWVVVLGGRRGWSLPFSASSATGCAHYRDEHSSPQAHSGWLWVISSRR